MGGDHRVAPDVVGGVPDYHEFAPELGDLRTVRTDGVFMRAGTVTTVLASQSEPCALVVDACEPGSVLLLAEATPLQNAASAKPTTAPRSPVPDPISRWCSPKACVATGNARASPRSPTAGRPDSCARAGRDPVRMVRACRLGPPDRPDRELPPARSLYVDAMADTLEHTQDRARALAPLGEWARNRIKVGAGLPPDADRDAVSAAARHMGLSEAEIVTLWQPPVDDDEVLALGRVATRVTDERT